MTARDKIAGTQTEDAGVYQMNMTDVEQFLADSTDRGCTASTVAAYRRWLTMLYEFLPEDKAVGETTLADFQTHLLDAGYNSGKINNCIAISRQFLTDMGHGTPAAPGRLKWEKDKDPSERMTLTRWDYRRLLTAAKETGDECGYLLVKTFAYTGIQSNELPEITVEHVKAGSFESVLWKKARRIRIPELLRRELLDYGARQGIRSGPLFRIRDGSKPLDRGQVNNNIRRLGKAAGLPKGKATPTALAELYHAAMAMDEEALERAKERLMDRRLEREQRTLGWHT